MPVSFPLRLAAAAALLLCAATDPRAGVISPVNPWTVGTGLECEFGSIQAALDAAAAAPGPQTIYITRLLTYTNQALLVNDADDVTLEGGYASCFSIRDADPVALSGTNAQSVIRVFGSGNVTLRQLDISGGGGSIPPGGGTRHGGGVLQAGGGLLTISNSHLHHSLGGNGSALAVVGTGSLELRDCTLLDNANVATFYPAVSVATTGTVDIRDCVLENNNSMAIDVSDAAEVHVQDCSIRNHNGTNTGYPSLRLAGAGAFHLEGVEVSGDLGGGIAFPGSGSLSLWDVAIADNGQLDAGGCLPQAALSITGGGAVALHESEITGNCGRFAGGIHIDEGTLSIQTTLIANNISTSTGGGISAVRATSALPPLVRFGPYALVEGNSTQGTSRGGGGGVYLAEATLDATQAPGHAIRGNSALDGGGLYLSAATARIGSGQGGGSIAGNAADTGGGGVLLAGNSEFLLYTTDPDTPAGIAGNTVTGNLLGGGILANGYDGSMRIFLHDARIVDNTAPIGGGVAMVASGGNNGIVFCLSSARRHDGCDAFGAQIPADARACNDPAQCNLLQGNRGEGIYGGAALFRATGPGAGAVPIRLVGARLIGNVGRSTITSMPADPLSGPPTGNLEIFDSVIAGNTATNALLDSAPPGVANFPPDAAFAMGPVTIERSTIAGNGIGANHVIGTRLGLQLRESIVHQPFATVHGGNAGGIDAHHLIVGNTGGLPVNDTIVVADPKLMNASNGDVRLLPDSPAIDFSSYGFGGYDVDGIPRGQDAPGVPSRFGLRDIGAHEVGTPGLFRDDFEGGPV